MLVYVKMIDDVSDKYITTFECQFSKLLLCVVPRL